MPQRMMLEFLMRFLMLSLIKNNHLYASVFMCDVLSDQEYIMNIIADIYD